MNRNKKNQLRSQTRPCTSCMANRWRTVTKDGDYGRTRLYKCRRCGNVREVVIVR